jgi:hypothetical protein
MYNINILYLYFVLRTQNDKCKTAIINTLTLLRSPWWETYFKYLVRITGDRVILFKDIPLRTPQN